MDLHYSAPRPDWELVRHTERNDWQQLAAQTGGIVTPGNILSALGLLFVLFGAAGIVGDRLWFGFTALLVGRLFDIADGMVASRTGTKSPLGEAVDVVCDKLGALAILIVLWSQQIVWWPALLAIALYHSINSVVGVLGKRSHAGIHPRETGKLSTFGQWAALIMLLLNAALDLSPHSLLAIVGYSVLTAALALGAYATSRYIESYLKSVALLSGAANRHTKQPGE